MESGGVRHSFDADHIAVIDNTTRKLVGEGTRAKVFREMRTGEFGEAKLERQLNSRGFLARLLGRVMLLVLASDAAAFTLPRYALLVLPVPFAAGTSLFDAADGCSWRGPTAGVRRFDSFQAQQRILDDLG